MTLRDRLGAIDLPQKGSFMKPPKKANILLDAKSVVKAELKYALAIFFSSLSGDVTMSPVRAMRKTGLVLSISTRAFPLTK